MHGARWLARIAQGMIPVLVATAAWLGAAAGREIGGGLGLSIDEPPDTRHEIAPGWRYGSEVEIDMERTRDFDLDSREDDDFIAVEPKLEVALAFTPNERVQAFLDLELGKVYLPKTPEGSTSQSTQLELKELFVTLRELIYPGFSLQLGRSNFEDPRTWLYDEELDGARVYIDIDPWVLELSATRLDWLPRDLFDNIPDEEEHINNYFAVAHVPYGEDSYAGLYLLARDDRRSDGEDLVFAGVQTQGELGATEYWLDAALVTGDDDGNDILGFGFDLGASYTFDTVLEPALTLGIAFGSGDANPEGKDHNFRQTGLEGNEGEFTGEASFQYYGEALDPELSNLRILTLGLGLHPTETTSIDLIYHHYRQDEAVDELRDSNLETEPDGAHRGLGQALDLVLGYESEAEDIEAKLILGWFFPGAAFPDDASDAIFGGVELKYQF